MLLNFLLLTFITVKEEVGFLVYASVFCELSKPESASLSLMIWTT